jgi:hypothetical protein
VILILFTLVWLKLETETGPTEVGYILHLNSLDESLRWQLEPRDCITNIRHKVTIGKCYVMNYSTKAGVLVHANACVLQS